MPPDGDGDDDDDDDDDDDGDDDDCGASVVYAWVGSECGVSLADVPTHVERLMQTRATPAYRCVVEAEGSETDEFWEAFEAGYE